MRITQRAEEYYAGLADPRRHYPLRYMLMVFPVREDKQALIPAVTHEERHVYIH